MEKEQRLEKNKRDLKGGARHKSILLISFPRAAHYRRYRDRHRGGQNHIDVIAHQPFANVRCKRRSLETDLFRRA
jgi:hypothetical protein